MALHLDRYREIAEILSRNGLSFVINVSGLHRFLPGNLSRFLPGQGAPTASISNPVVVRQTLEELGTTFIKLGQLLSTRSDLLPPSYQAELAKLQDSTLPVDAATIHRLIQQELGADPTQIFATFDDHPIASASIGQAHVATLHDGTEVVVKVRREHVVEECEQDLGILNSLTSYAARNWSFMEDYNIVGFVDEFSESLRAELDYVREARACDRFAESFEDQADLQIPHIYWKQTTSRVLTQQRIRGIKITDVAALDRAGIDRPRLAITATNMALDMIFRDGYFHADPHPGNMFVKDGGVIGLIDFGMVGELSDRLRDQLGQMFIALSVEDPERITSLLLEIAPAKGRVDRAAISRDVKRIMRSIHDKRLEDVKLSRVLTQILGVLRSNRLQLPSEIALMFRMLTMMEGIGEVLDPGFSMTAVIRPYGAQLLFDRLRPRTVLRTASRKGLEVFEVASGLPERLLRILDDYERTGVEIQVNGDELDPYVRRVERIGTRLVAGMVFAATINVVGDLLVANSKPGEKLNLPAALASTLGIGAIGGYLVISARPRRHRRR